MNQTMQLLTSSEQDNWHTPVIYTDAAREVMGGIDLDPASDPLANQRIRATRFYTKEDNGLIPRWEGKVFCNPPYGKINNLSLQGLFAGKMEQEWRHGYLEQGILLVNLYSGYNWFKPLRTMPMCLVDHRISFINPATGMQGEPAKASSVFVYFGRHEITFYRVFSEFGPCGQFGYWK